MLRQPAPEIGVPTDVGIRTGHREDQGRHFHQRHGEDGDGLDGNMLGAILGRSENGDGDGESPVYWLSAMIDSFIVIVVRPLSVLAHRQRPLGTSCDIAQ
jgi:hypothetical protein